MVKGFVYWSTGALAFTRWTVDESNIYELRSSLSLFIIESVRSRYPKVWINIKFSSEI